MKCFCYENWEGVTCSNYVCKGGCSGHGSCKNGYCTCQPGYTGQDCSEGVSKCPGHVNQTGADCSGNGECIGSQCHCRTGYFGPACEVPYCPNKCSGHGQCTPHGLCECSGMWEGVACDERPCD